MPLSRLIYISENQLDPSQGSVVRQLSEILKASNRNNREAGLTGALVFDDAWFLQMLEGERSQVWRSFERIKDDERHSGVILVEMREVAERMFANWWMGVATRTAQNAHLFAPFTRAGSLRAETMSAHDIVTLMRDLATVGLSRELAAAAA